MLEDFHDYRLIVSCEGNAEEEILNILLENDFLQFKKDIMLDSSPTRIRQAKKIEEKYLQYSHDKEIIIIRILDSKRENFKLSKLYNNKVFNIVTKPEIEILIIIAENKYEDYTNRYKHQFKPSEYLKNILKMKEVKSENFYKNYFKDPLKLIRAIIQFHRVCNDCEYTLYNLLNHNAQNLNVL